MPENFFVKIRKKINPYMKVKNETKNTYIVVSSKCPFKGISGGLSSRWIG